MIKRFSIVGILLITVIVSYGTWQLYCTLNGKQVDDRHDKNNVQNGDIGEFTNALLGKEEASSRNKKIVTDFWENIRETQIITKDNGNSTIWVWGITNGILIVYILLTKEKLKVIANLISLNIGWVLYMISNLWIFMMVFQEYQGETLMGFERYIQTYMLAMVLNVIYLIMEKINLKTAIITLAFMLIMRNGLYRFMIDPRIVRNNNSVYGTIIEENANEIISQVKEEEKIYLLDQKLDYGFEFMQIRYLISPRRTNLLYEWNIGKNENEVYYRIDMTEDEWIEKLVAENYDYVYIININRSLLEAYQNVFTQRAKQDLQEIMIEDTELYEEKQVKGVLLKVNAQEKKVESMN